MAASNRKCFCCLWPEWFRKYQFRCRARFRKIFIKVAGIATAESIRTKEEAIASLKSAMSVYETITHPHLIELIDHGSLDDLYISVFKWTSGDCLFDHWNFEKYDNNPQLIPPAKRFRQLPLKKRIAAAEVLFSFWILFLKADMLRLIFMQEA